MDYVLGFCFSKEWGVLLIRKKRPQWMAGKLNGIGGKIEPGEIAIDAMRREFREEACLDLDGWIQFCLIRAFEPNGDPYSITCFYNLVDDSILQKAESGTDEEVFIYSEIDTTKRVHLGIMHNLPWLITMAREIAFGRAPNNRYILEDVASAEGI